MRTVAAKHIFLLFLLLLYSACQSQEKLISNFQIEKTIDLDNTLKETSGLAFYNGFLWSHNDSGDGAYIYKVDTTSGKVILQIKVMNTKNRDWEDLAIDDQYLYIADIGDNNLKRKNLRIIKISLDSLEKSQTVVYPEMEIQFFYKNEKGKTKRHDAEALISFKDYLYIFTKERSNNQSKIFRINKSDKEQIAAYLGEFNAKGLITGACYNKVNDEIMLIGHTKLGPLYSNFIWQFRPDELQYISSKGMYDELEINSQIEGIAIDTASQIILSAESQDLSSSKLYFLVPKDQN